MFKGLNAKNAESIFLFENRNALLSLLFIMSTKGYEMNPRKYIHHHAYMRHVFTIAKIGTLLEISGFFFGWKSPKGNK